MMATRRPFAALFIACRYPFPLSLSIRGFGEGCKASKVSASLWWPLSALQGPLLSLVAITSISSSSLSLPPLLSLSHFSFPVRFFVFVLVHAGLVQAIPTCCWLARTGTGFDFAFLGVIKSSQFGIGWYTYQDEKSFFLCFWGMAWFNMCDLSHADDSWSLPTCPCGFRNFILQIRYLFVTKNNNPYIHGIGNFWSKSNLLGLRPISHFYHSWFHVWFAPFNNQAHPKIKSLLTWKVGIKEKDQIVIFKLESFKWWTSKWSLWFATIWHIQLKYVMHIRYNTKIIHKYMLCVNAELQMDHMIQLYATPISILTWD